MFNQIRVPIQHIPSQLELGQVDVWSERDVI